MNDGPIIVLGAAVWPGGVPSPTLLRRTRYACRLFLDGGHPQLVLSGGIGKYPPAEAEVMAHIARDMGVPDSALILDTAARTTIETAAFVARSGIDRSAGLVVVTDGYHAPRTWLAFRSYGLSARLRCPPLGHDTDVTKRIWSFAREVPALLWYLGYFFRTRRHN